MSGVLETYHQRHLERRARFYTPREVTPKSQTPRVVPVRAFTPEQLVWKPPAEPKPKPAQATQPVEVKPIPRTFPQVREVIKAVSVEFKVSAVDIISVRRTANVMLPRHVAMYVARHVTPLALNAIAQRFGDRDHTTILHGIKKMAALIAKDPALAERVKRLVDSLQRELPDEGA